MSRVARRKRMAAAYSFMDELMASPTNPMPEAMQNYQMTRIYAGLDSLEKAPSPSKQDWEMVVDAVNLTETLVREMNIAEDNSGLLQDAANALAKAGERHLKTGANIRLDGAGLQAVRAVIEDYGLMLATLPHRTMIQCHRLTERRLIDLQSGKRKLHDVVVVKL